jgi:hypothetical protein
VIMQKSVELKYKRMRPLGVKRKVLVGKECQHEITKMIAPLRARHEDLELNEPPSAE